MVSHVDLRRSLPYPQSPSSVLSHPPPACYSQCVNDVVTMQADQVSAQALPQKRVRRRSDCTSELSEGSSPSRPELSAAGSRADLLLGAERSRRSMAGAGPGPLSRRCSAGVTSAANPDAVEDGSDLMAARV